MSRIMLVDDEPNITYMLKESLISLGYDVVATAASGSEAVSMAREYHPDLILMDIVMPGDLDGIDAAAAIRADMDIPIIFLTGHSEPELTERAKQIEPHGYILKTCHEYQIKAAIEIALFKNQSERAVAKAHRDLENRVREKTAELRTKNAQLTALLNATTDTAFLIDVKGKVLASNAVAANRFNVPLETFLNSCVYDLMPPNLAKARRRKAWKVIQTGEPFRFEDQLREIIFDTTIYPVFSSEGMVIQLAIYGRNITLQRQTEEALKDRENELKQRARELEEANAALRVLLRRRDQDMAELEERVVASVTQRVHPYLIELNQHQSDSKQKALIGVIESNLHDIVSPFASKLSSKAYGLTPKELRVAELVKADKTTKEIAELMAISTKTVEYHRDNVRKKLGIKNKKINLKSHLLSFT